MKDLKKIIVSKEQWEKALIELEKLPEQDLDYYYVDLKKDGMLYINPKVICTYFFNMDAVIKKIDNYNEEDNTYYLFNNKYGFDGEPANNYCGNDYFLEKKRFLDFIVEFKSASSRLRQSADRLAKYANFLENLENNV